jgi:hypothetical protein
MFENWDVMKGTLSFWIRPQAWAGGDGRWHTILAEEVAGPMLHKDVDNRLYFAAPGVGDIVSGLVSNENLTADQWHNVTLVWDAQHTVQGQSYASMLLDGTIIGERDQPFSPEPWGNIVIGASRDGSSPGQIDTAGFALWDRPLTLQEVQHVQTSGPDKGGASATDSSTRIVQAAGSDGGDFLTLPSMGNYTATAAVRASDWAPLGQPLTVEPLRWSGAGLSLSTLVDAPPANGVQKVLHVLPASSEVVSGLVRVESGSVDIVVMDGSDSTLARDVLKARPEWQPFALQVDGPEALRAMAGPNGGRFLIDNIAVVPGQVVSESCTTSQGPTAAGRRWYALIGTSESSLTKADSLTRTCESAGMTPGTRPSAIAVELEPLTQTWATDLWSTPGHGHGGEERRLWGLLLGVAMLYALANTPASTIGRWYMPGLIVVAGLIALGAVSVTDWDLVNKVFGVAGLQKLIPQVRIHLVEASDSGLINPNELGGALASTIPIAAAVLCFARGSLRTAAAMTLLLSSAVVVLTQSRGGMLASVAGLAIVVLVRFRAGRRAVLGLVAISIGLLSMLALRSGIALAMVVGGRVDVWSRAWAILREHAFTGIGLGRFDLAYAAYFATLADPEPLVPHAHNLVLQAVLDLGLVGGLAYCSLFVVALITAMRMLYRSVGAASLFAAGLAGSMVAALIFGTTDTIAPGARASLLYWVLFGLVASSAAVSTGRSAIGALPLRRDASPESIPTPRTREAVERGSTNF